MPTPNMPSPEFARYLEARRAYEAATASPDDEGWEARVHQRISPMRRRSPP